MYLPAEQLVTFNGTTRLIEQLEICAELGPSDPHVLGDVLVQSFLVDIRQRLLDSSLVGCSLPSLGVLFRNNTTVGFYSAYELRKDLRARKLLLLSELDPFVEEESLGLPVFHQRRLDEALRDMHGTVSGDDFLRAVAYLVMKALVRDDPSMQRLRRKLADESLRSALTHQLERLLYLAMHDVLCTGSDLRLLSIGVWSHRDDTITFEASDHLTAALEATYTIPQRTAVKRWSVPDTEDQQLGTLEAAEPYSPPTKVGAL